MPATLWRIGGVHNPAGHFDAGVGSVYFFRLNVMGLELAPMATVPCKESPLFETFTLPAFFVNAIMTGLPSILATPESLPRGA